MEKVNISDNLLFSQKRIARIKIILIASFFLFPVIYLVSTVSNGSKKYSVNKASEEQDRTIETLEAKVKVNPIIENLIDLSMEYINKQMPGKSIEHLKKAIALSPENSIAYNNLGVAYIMLQQYQNGIEACQKALTIDPAFQLAKNNLKWGNDEKEKVLKEIQSQELVPASKKDIEFYFSNGMNYYKLGDYGKSIEIWNKIFEIDPKNTEALNNIATAFMMKGQAEDAELLFKKVIELEPDNELARNNLFWAQTEISKKK